MRTMQRYKQFAQKRELKIFQALIQWKHTVRKKSKSLTLRVVRVMSENSFPPLAAWVFCVFPARCLQSQYICVWGCVHG